MNLTDRPTPETDKAAGYMAVDDSGFHRHPAGGLVPVDFARNLERQKAALREALKECEGDLACYDNDPQWPAKNATLKRVRATLAATEPKA